MRETRQYSLRHSRQLKKLGLVWGAPRLPNASRVPKTLRQLLPKAPAGSRTPPSASLSSLGTVAESESATPTAGSPNSSPENKLYHARSNSSTAAFTPSLGTEQQEAGQGSSRIVLDLDVLSRSTSPDPLLLVQSSQEWPNGRGQGQGLDARHSSRGLLHIAPKHRLHQQQPAHLPSPTTTLPRQLPLPPTAATTDTLSSPSTHPSDDTTVSIVASPSLSDADDADRDNNDADAIAPSPSPSACRVASRRCSIAVASPPPPTPQTPFIATCRIPAQAIVPSLSNEAIPLSQASAIELAGQAHSGQEGGQEGVQEDGQEDGQPAGQVAHIGTPPPLNANRFDKSSPSSIARDARVALKLLKQRLGIHRHNALLSIGRRIATSSRETSRSASICASPLLPDSRTGIRGNNSIGGMSGYGSSLDTAVDVPLSGHGMDCIEAGHSQPPSQDTLDPSLMVMFKYLYLYLDCQLQDADDEMYRHQLAEFHGLPSDTGSTPQMDISAVPRMRFPALHPTFDRAAHSAPFYLFRIDLDTVSLQAGDFRNISVFETKAHQLLECTTRVYSFGKRILETREVQRPQERMMPEPRRHLQQPQQSQMQDDDGVALDDSMDCISVHSDSSNVSHMLVDQVEQPGPAERLDSQATAEPLPGSQPPQDRPPSLSYLYQFDFARHFFSAFLGGLQFLDGPEEVRMAIEHLTVMQTVDALDPADHTARTTRLCIAYEFRCGNGSVEAIQLFKSKMLSRHGAQVARHTDSRG